MALKLFFILTSVLIVLTVSIACYYFRHDIYQYLGNVSEEYDVLPTAEKIIDGRFAFISVYPYHVQYGDMCNGAIIHKLWVLSAAHCPDWEHIRVGSHFRDKGTVVNITSKHPHERYKYELNGHNLEFDIQLMNLAENLTWSDCVQPIGISRRRYYPNTSWFTVTGFGDYYARGPLSNVLQVIMVKRQKESSCLGPYRYGYHRNVSLNILCLGIPAGRHDICMGDAGGPAVFENGLAALAIWGRGCLDPEEETIITGWVPNRQYSFYGTVSTLKAWIESTTKEKFQYVG